MNIDKNPELDRWNERFAGEAYHFGTAPNAFLAAQGHRLQPGMTALAIADGEGRNSVWLAAQGLRVTAFDFAPLGVAKAQRLARDRGVDVDYRVADIRGWDWDGAKYDVIAAIFFQFANPTDRARIFAGISRALNPGGLLLLQGYRIEKDAGMIGQSKGLEAADELLKHDPTAVMNNFRSSWSNLLTALGLPMVDTALTGMNQFADAFKSLTTFFVAHQHRQIRRGTSVSPVIFGALSRRTSFNFFIFHFVMKKYYISVSGPSSF